jgi:hypothetical protein
MGRGREAGCRRGGAHSSVAFRVRTVHAFVPEVSMHTRRNLSTALIGYDLELHIVFNSKVGF